MKTLASRHPFCSGTIFSDCVQRHMTLRLHHPEGISTRRDASRWCGRELYFGSRHDLFSTCWRWYCSKDSIVIYDAQRTYDDFITSNTVSAVLAAIMEDQILHTVQGLEYCGLLLDPGASKAILGSDTLNDIIDYVLEPVDHAGQVHCFHFRPVMADTRRCPWWVLSGTCVSANVDTDTVALTHHLLATLFSYFFPMDLFDKPVDANLVSFMQKHFTHKLSTSIPDLDKGNKSRGLPLHGKDNTFIVTFFSVMTQRHLTINITTKTKTTTTKTTSIGTILFESRTWR